MLATCAELFARMLGRVIHRIAGVHQVDVVITSDGGRSNNVGATANDWVPHRQACATQTDRLLRMINGGTLDLVDLLDRSFNLHKGFSQRRTQADQFRHCLPQCSGHEP